MGRSIAVVLIAIGMSLVGLLLLDAVGVEEISLAGSGGSTGFNAYIALVSSALWLTAYHVWIKHGTRLQDKVMLAIGMPFIGTFVAAPFFGIIVFFWFWWVFIPVSFVTVSLLALIAGQRPQEGSAP